MSLQTFGRIAASSGVMNLGVKTHVTESPGENKHAPSSAALTEGSRADCIQTISPRVQVSTRVRTCIPY